MTRLSWRSCVRRLETESVEDRCNRRHSSSVPPGNQAQSQTCGRSGIAVSLELFVRPSAQIRAVRSPLLVANHAPSGGDRHCGDPAAAAFTDGKNGTAFKALARTVVGSTRRVIPPVPGEY